jgi:hypothetical protein
MIPGKINTHLLQDLTVLAKANQKGSVVYISTDKKIHSGTIFQKLQAFIFKNKKDAFLDPIEIGTLNQSAKELVTENLKDQIKISLTLKNIKIEKPIETDIKEISEYLVNQITRSEISNKNDVLKKFDHLIKNFNEIRADDKKPPSLSMGPQLMIDAISDVVTINKFAIKNGSEFKFVKEQINTRLDRNEKNANPIDFEKINSIAENSAWVKKNKGVVSERALILGKEMARDELIGLTNNQKFNGIQNTIKSLWGKGRDAIEKQLSLKLKEYGKLKREKNLEQYINTLSKEEMSGLNKTEMKKKLLDHRFKGLNPQGRYQAFLELKVIENNKNYYEDSGLNFTKFKNFKDFDIVSDDDPKTPTPAQDIQRAINIIRSEPKYQEK